jgi:hypothetical protein
MPGGRVRRGGALGLTLLVACATPAASPPASADDLWSPSLSEVVLYGLRPASELDPTRYPAAGGACVAAYLRALTRAPAAAQPQPADDAEAVVRARRGSLEAQAVALLGPRAAADAKGFARAVPLAAEWEGMSEGPRAEASGAEQWLRMHPRTALEPFVHLFAAHRLRAAYEAAWREEGAKRAAGLALGYAQQLELARRTSNRLISCVADDLDAQPHVYLPGAPKP